MKLEWLVPREELPSTRIRVRDLARELEAHGFESRVSAFPDGFAARRALGRELRAADFVIVHRVLPRFVEALWLRGLDRRLIFDFDDAVFLRKRARHGSHASSHRSRAFRRVLAHFDGLVAGNRYLASHCEHSRAAVLIAPSAVPLDVPQRQVRRADGVTRVGWVGLSSNLVYLREQAPVWRTLAGRRAFRLTIVSDEPLTLDGVQVENRPWTLEGQGRAIADFDVGVMPLALDSPWSKGKCAYKLLQYMAAGVAVVGSRVGMNEDVIADGVNGFLAASDDEWLRALERLIDDPAARERLGRAGRELVAREYGYSSVAARWAEFLRTLARR